MFCNLQFSITIYSKTVDFEVGNICIELLSQNGIISLRT